MSLFNKKLSLEDILKAIDGLSEEEKAKLKAKIDGTTEETELPEENQVDNTEETGEVPAEETATEEPTEEIGAETEGVEEQPSVEGAEQTPQTPPETEELNGVEQDNSNEVMQGITERLQAIEEKLAEFDELKSLMEEYTKKQADSFGYKGAVPGGKKDIHDMDAKELKAKLLNGEI